MSSLIEATTIATNPYAASGAQAVNLYSFNDCENLTIGQLVNAVCCRIGVALEDQSINKVNVMTRDARRLKGMSEILSGVIAGNGYDTKMSLEGYTDTTYRDFLTNICHIAIGTDDGLPSDISTPTGRINFYSVIKSSIQADTVTNQQDLVDLQSNISRRDVAYTTATNVVRALGNANLNTAWNF